MASQHQDLKPGRRSSLWDWSSGGWLYETVVSVPETGMSYPKNLRPGDELYVTFGGHRVYYLPKSKIRFGTQGDLCKFFLLHHKEFTGSIFGALAWLHFHEEVLK